MALAEPRVLADLANLVPFKIVAADRQIEFVASDHEMDFDRPFWNITMRDLEARHKTGDLETVAVSFARLRELVGPTRPRPTGMIFHIGRCGSTLVSRIVGHAENALVLREASPIGGLHRASPGTADVPTFSLEQAFTDLLVAFDQFAAPRDQRVIVKHSSWESFSMERIATLVPDTPIVFVYRDPVAVVESSLASHPGWARRIHERRDQLQRWVPAIRNVPAPSTAAAVYASVWASGVSAALRLPPGRVRFIDHAQLTSEPRTTIEHIGSHFDLNLDADLALGELGQYSKGSVDGTPFDPQAEHARPPLSSRTRAQVLDIVGDLPIQLSAQLIRQDEKQGLRI